MRKLRRIILLASSVAIAAVGLGGQLDGVVAAPAAYKVAVKCNANPEQVTFTNNSASPVTIYTVTSTFHKTSAEPFHVNTYLLAGGVRTWQSGSNATTNVLTHAFLYDNDHRDGARLHTSAGDFTKHCP